MDFNILTKKWCNLSDNATIIIVTDSDTIILAKEIKSQITNKCHIINIEEQPNYYNELLKLASYDLLIALFAFNTYIYKGVNKIFSPFSKPKNILSKYVFIRLSITKESLLEGLSTNEKLIYETIDKLHSYKDRSKLHITNVAGTDITLSIHSFGTCKHQTKEDGVWLSCRHLKHQLR